MSVQAVLVYRLFLVVQLNLYSPTVNDHPGANARNDDDKAHGNQHSGGVYHRIGITKRAGVIPAHTNICIESLKKINGYNLMQSEDNDDSGLSST